MSLKVDFIKSVKDAFGDSSEDIARRTVFQRIFDLLHNKQSHHPKGKNSTDEEDSVLELLRDNAVWLPLFVRVEQSGQLLLHAALARRDPSPSLEVIRLLVQADDTRETLLRPSPALRHMIPLHLALQNASSSSSYEVVEYLMQADDDDDDRRRLSWTTPHEATGRLPLHWAAARGWTRICQRLLDEHPQGASVVDRHDKRLPLHEAAASGVPDAVRACLLVGGGVCHGDREGALPLHRAGSVAVMEVLLTEDDAETRSSWNARTETGRTPLHTLVGLSSPAEDDDDLAVEVLRKLIERDESMLEEMDRSTGWTPLHLALQRASPDVIRALVSQSPFHVMVLRCGKGGNLPVHYAVTRGSDIARVVVDADPTLLDARNTDPGGTPLARLVARSDADAATVRYLLDTDDRAARVPDDYGCLPLHAALGAGAGPEIVRMLLQAHPGAVYAPQQQGALPLHLAARNSSSSSSSSEGTSLDVLEMLLAQDPTRKTLLTPAKDGCLPIHEILRDSFVCQNMSDENHAAETSAVKSARTPGGSTAQSIMDFFLRGDPEHISLTARDLHGRTPLHYAARLQQGNPSVGLVDVKALVEAEPEAVLLADNDGNLPLHLAANMKQPIPQMIEMLVAADPTRTSLVARNKDAHIPLALARERDTPDSVLKLLRVGTGPFIEDQAEQTQQLWRRIRNLLHQQSATVQLLENAVSGDDLSRLVTFRDNFGVSLLHVAAGHSNAEILRVILRSNPSMLLVAEETHGELPIHVAAMSPNGTAEMMELLMAADETKSSLYTPDFHGRLPLHNVIRYGADPAKTSCLVKGDPSLKTLYASDCAGKLAIHYHCGAHAEEAVSILVGADATKEILHMSTQTRDLPIHVHARQPKLSRLLMQADGPNKPTLLAANAVGDLPLHAMVSSIEMTPDIVELYAQLAPAAFGVAGEGAELPLHRATRFTATMSVVQAVHHAAPENVCSQDAAGNLPIHLAAMREARKFTGDGPPALLDFMIAQYPEGVKVPNAAGQYALHAAADLNAAPSTLLVLERLWQAGSPLTDTSGDHLIHYLARHANQIRSPERFLSPILKALLRLDANALNAKNIFGLTAQQLLHEYTEDETLLDLFQPMTG